MKVEKGRTNVYTGLHIAPAGLELGGLGKIITNQPSAGQPVKLVLCSKKQNMLNNQFEIDIVKIEGKKCWSIVGGAGVGSIISLGFGKKLKRSKPVSNQHLTEDERIFEPEFYLMFFGPWRVELGTEIISASYYNNANDGPMVRGLNTLRNQFVQSVICQKPAYDLSIIFDNNLKFSLYCSNFGEDDTFYTYSTQNGCYAVEFDGQLSYEKT